MLMAKAGKCRAGLPELTPIERAVYDICVAAAEANRPLDSTEQISAAIGATSFSTVPHILRRIEKKGWISRSVFQKGRQVCIAATGRCTVPPADQTPHWRRTLDRSKDSTPTLPRHTIVQTMPTLMTYLDTMMREENMTMMAAQLVLMARGMQHREEERAKC